MKKYSQLNYPRKTTNKELQEMLLSYSGKSDLVLSVRDQLKTKGFNKLTNKQRFFSELIILKEKSVLDDHFKDVVKSIVD